MGGVGGFTSIFLPALLLSPRASLDSSTTVGVIVATFNDCKQDKIDIFVPAEGRSAEIAASEGSFALLLA